LFIPVHKYKIEIKEFKDRENAHRDLYWFTLNQELHPVFPETTRESTKQSTQITYNPTKEVTLIPSRHTLPLVQYNTTKNVDLDPLKNTQHFSAIHTEFLSKYKGLHLLQKRYEISTT